jgi:lysophospholipase L1-like esterase
MSWPNAQNSGGPAYSCCVRGQPNTDAYYSYYSNGSYAVGRISSGAPVSLTSGSLQTSVTITQGHSITNKLLITGDGLTTSTLTATLTDTTTNTVLATLTGTDTAAELQSGGRVGTYAYLASGASISASELIVYSDTAIPFSTTYIGYVGDSLTYGLSTKQTTIPDLMCRALSVRNPTMRYLPINMGFSGAFTSSWLPGNGSGYAAALQNFTVLGAKTIIITLGGNDALYGVAAPTWFANMQTIINSFAAAIPGVRIIVNFPASFDWLRFYNTFGSPTSAAALPLLKSYLPYLSQLTGCVIGDINAINTFLPNVDFYGLTDGGHPNDQGVPVLASLWLNAAFPSVSASPARQARRF